MLRKFSTIFFKIDNSIVKTSMEISVYLSKNKGERIEQLEYCLIITSLMYLMNCTSAYSIISSTSNGLILSQYYYVEKVLDKIFKDDNNIVKT